MFCISKYSLFLISNSKEKAKSNPRTSGTQERRSNRNKKDLACSGEDRGVGEGQDWIDPPIGWCRYGPPLDVLPPRKGRGSNTVRPYLPVTSGASAYLLLLSFDGCLCSVYKSKRCAPQQNAYHEIIERPGC